VLTDLDSRLNKEQYEAVVSDKRSLLVLAGAGTGKTRVITYRIAYLIKNCNVQPGNILAVTFTNKASSEMKQRLYSIIGSLASALHIGTFHSICLNILRTDGYHLGIDSHVSVIDQDDRLSILKRIIKELNIDDKRYHPRKYLHFISEFKNSINFVNMLKPNDIIDRLSLVFDIYQEELNSARQIDFDDMLALVVRLFLKEAEVLSRYQELYKYILVDEYQDTNKIQSIFLSLIGKTNNLCVVGDDDQSIYGWRGADIRNILDFDKEYEDVHEIKLLDNYRAGQKILDIANRVIENNLDRRGKRLKAAIDIDTKIISKRFPTESLESNYVSEEIYNLINHKGISCSDIAILYRTNAQSRNFEVSLNRFNIANKVIGAISFFQRKEVKDILSYLRFYDNRYDQLSFRRSIKTPLRGIGDATIDKIISNATAKEIDLFSSLLEYTDENIKHRNKLDNYLQLFIKLDTITSIKDKINEVVERIDYLSYLKQYEDIDTANKRVDNIAELYSAAVDYEGSVAELSLTDFLASTILVSSPDGDDKSSVKLMTIHASKGLEFDTIFLTGLEEGLFPSSQSMDEGNIEEERRLCYVAITRAKRELHLTSVRDRLTYGKRKSSIESIFLSEMGLGNELKLDRNIFNRDNVVRLGYKQDLILEDRLVIEEGKEINDRLSEGDNSLVVSDKVTHSIFGDGVVLSVDKRDKDSRVLVHFKSSGQKKILSSFLKKRFK